MKRCSLVLLSVLTLCVSLLSGCNGANGNTTPGTSAGPVDPDNSIQTEFVGRTAPVVEAQDAVTGTATEFTVSRVFSKNMVIQRDEYIRIWGWAPESQNGKIVSASFKGLNGHAEIKDGEWMITLGGTLPASTEKGHSLVVSGAEGVSEIFKDVLVGDNYWIAGQSNAAYKMAECIASVPDGHPVKDIDFDDNDPIRIFINSWDDWHVLNDELSEDVTTRRLWQMPKRSGKQMSALAYLFAKQLVSKTNGTVPIGIISFSGSGMPLSAFLPGEVAEALGADAFHTIDKCYYAPDFWGQSGQHSRRMYNQLVYPFQNFPVTGMLWYQGESDMNQASRDVYVKYFTAMIEEYRSRLNQNYKDFPVLVIELPTIYSNASVTSFMDFSIVRSIMGGIPASLKNSYMVASSDIWKDQTFGNNLHPYCKMEQAARAVEMMLPMFYGGETGLSYLEGPTAMKYSYSKNNKSVSIQYRSVGDGLKVQGEALKGFEVLVDGKWIEPKEAKIQGKDIVVLSADQTIDGVRYHAIHDTSFPETLTLCNSNNIPAVACNNMRPAS